MLKDEPYDSNCTGVLTNDDRVPSRRAVHQGERQLQNIDLNVGLSRSKSSTKSAAGQADHTKTTDIDLETYDSVDTKQVDERTNAHDDSNYLVTKSEGIHSPTDINSVINGRIDKFGQSIGLTDDNRTKKRRSSKANESDRGKKCTADPRSNENALHERYEFKRSEDPNPKESIRSNEETDKSKRPSEYLNDDNDLDTHKNSPATSVNRQQEGCSMPADQKNDFEASRPVETVHTIGAQTHQPIKKCRSIKEDPTVFNTNDNKRFNKKPSNTELTGSRTKAKATIKKVDCNGKDKKVHEGTLVFNANTDGLHPDSFVLDFGRANRHAMRSLRGCVERRTTHEPPVYSASKQTLPTNGSGGFE